MQQEFWVNSVSFSPDGSTLAAAFFNVNAIKLWGVATGEVRVLHGLGNSVSFSPDGKTIVAGGGDYTVRIWEVATGKMIHTLRGHKKSVDCVSFSPQGNIIASGSDDATVKLWGELGK